MLRRLVRRRRRLLAASAAFLAVLFLVPALRPAAAPLAPEPEPRPPTGQVAIPVPVLDTGGFVSVGDRIDLLGVSTDGVLGPVARDATVLATSVDAGGLVLLVGVAESEKLPVVRAMTVDELVVVLHPRALAG
jgi:hypothetical protein